MKFDMKRSSKMAVILYLLGFKYSVSSFEDFTTYGYGKLSDFGFWQYDLIEKQ